MGSCLGGLRDPNGAGSRMLGRTGRRRRHLSPLNYRAQSPSGSPLQPSTSPPCCCVAGLINEFLSPSGLRSPSAHQPAAESHQSSSSSSVFSSVPSTPPPQSPLRPPPSNRSILRFFRSTPSSSSPSPDQVFQVSNANNILDIPFKEITDRYVIGETLGEGRLGRTFVCTEKSTGHQYACKEILKERLHRQSDKDDVKREVEIRQHLSGQPNIVEFKEVYEDVNAVFIVMELCTGGNLFDMISSEGRHTERVIASIIRDIVNAVQVCHNKGVMHGEINPDNFLLSSKDDGAVLKAIDFGHSRIVEEGMGFSDPVEASYYHAPEAIGGSYGKEIDIWSVGVILYLLLSGVAPFYADTEVELWVATMRCEIDFNSPPWPSVSNSAKDLIRMMLTVDQWQRISPEQVLDFPWIRGGEASDIPMDSTVLARLKNFIAMNNTKIGGSTSESDGNPS